MTACAIETAAEDGSEDGAVGSARSTGSTTFTITVGGAYAARLAGEGEALFPERWTLDGPEPYAVPLPLDQPEEREAQVLPLTDGRVLIRRRVAGRHTFSLLYPTGPGTGELPLGGIEAAEVTLLPPSPDGLSAYALAPGAQSTSIWLVAGGAFGPEHVAEVPGRCSGGVWLDRTGRILALDVQLDAGPGGGPVKAVAVDLGRDGEVTPLLQITEDSDDRLLLADPDSGLLLVRSNAPGHDRLGWGVVGSLRPVRFPDCLRLADCAVTPFAVQPGQVLMPESCAVALRIDGAAGSWLGVWRPALRRLHQLVAPEGWLAGAGLWSREGVLHLPYATAAVPCGVALLEGPEDACVSDVITDPQMTAEPQLITEPQVITEPAQVERAGGEPSGDTGSPVVCRPVPLQQAPLTGRTAPG
ncbi:hypothetical protein OG883_23015 [Streptomyces sp. NBC_01142]|uniref:hypothetical protein n=1 Tax=Streptomyces sp. NBC_01142 TaxID=2975865 RepID=UPI00224D0A48|nr:hypothetical protein [Streptomyces sp. NBC_01142]MCX4822717.1 hypothetical protein [Streptomyces sp. NBC_01142]